ncbi:MAG: methionyl-tRNA formyltransferase [Actinomycetota bacterium]|nr:methionyl-tRNA formyltransferase [Actinomycetota bacterium]
MKLLFLGSSEFSVPFLESLYCSYHDVVMVVTSTDAPQGRGKKVLPNPVKKKAAELGIRVLEANSIGKRELAFIKGEEFQAAVIVSCGIILPQSFLDIFPHKCINVHPSLLPLHRGPAPITEAIKKGDDVTGVSIMEVTLKLDSGPIFTQVKLRINPLDNRQSLKKKLIKLGCPLLEATLSMIEQENLTPFEQDESKATYTKRFETQDLKIDWAKKSSHVLNMIRAYSPSPGCFTFLKGKRIKLIEAALADSKYKDQTPGSVVSIDDKRGILVSCGQDTGLIIKVLKPENKRAMNFKDFLNGYDLMPGERFE